MRISDDRYSRERVCLDLALRFLRHEGAPFALVHALH
jgi:hypothetical protein